MDDDVLFRLELRVCPALAGAPVQAVQYGRTGAIHVSPELFQRCKDATPAELETILKTTPVRVLPPEANPTSMFQYLAMPVRHAEWN